MRSVIDIAREIVAREGGYANDRNDPGGPTKHGVTIHTARRLHLDLDSNGRVDEADMRLISRDLAVEIFLRDYFHRPGIARLPSVLQASVFDMQVNAGANAVKILQRLLTRMGFACTADGMIGPQTVAAADAAHKAHPATLADAYGVARRDYYYALGDAREASRKYCRRRDGGKGGWITRAEEFVSPNLHLTEAQHSARIAHWA